MIEDLIFKGRNIQEALEKASNFFGVSVDIIKYEKVSQSAEGDVAIRLTENPILAQKKKESVSPVPDRQPQFNEPVHHYPQGGYPPRRERYQSGTERSGFQQSSGRYGQPQERTPSRQERVPPQSDRYPRQQDKYPPRQPSQQGYPQQNRTAEFNRERSRPQQRPAPFNARRNEPQN
ncbi:MAG: hypothetical protein NTX52_05315, partial [Planctomycetota bacterium]|nr:hypothetical protein [Planctomycetota bacterium]